MVARRKLPVAAFRYSVAIHVHDLSRPHLAHAGIDRGFGVLREHEQFAKAVLVHARSHSGVCKNRFRLRAEQHAVRRGVVEEGLHAHTVASQKQLLGNDVPDREGEHAVETLDDLVTPLQISAQHDLRVATGLEVMAEALELVLQLHEVVDLAGIDEGGDCPPLFLRLHRLHAASEIDDGEAAMPQTDMPGDENAARIRTAERHSFRHPRNDVALRPEIALVAHPTGYSAHRVTFLVRLRYCERVRSSKVGCREPVTPFHRYGRALFRLANESAYQEPGR